MVKDLGLQPDVLRLYPDGYPIYVDVAQHEVDGTGVALRFELPVHGINLPLSHHLETKLVVALTGRLALRQGATRPLMIERGEAAIVPPGTAHRIAQQGEHPCMVGVVLWPGAIEMAFREVAAMIARHGFHRPDVVSLFATYAVKWEGHNSDAAPKLPLQAMNFSEAADRMPVELCGLVRSRWAL